MRRWKQLFKIFLCEYSPKICAFSSRITWRNLMLKYRTELATLTSLLKNDKFGSICFNKTKMPNSMILPRRTVDFKARSHCVRKADFNILEAGQCLL